MSNAAKDYYEQNAQAMKQVRSAVPEVIKGFSVLHQATMKAGALQVREKELIALGIGLAVRCENCIYSHVQAAINAEATREKVLETAGVAVMMQGRPTYTYLPRLLDALDALGVKEQRSLQIEATP